MRLDLGMLVTRYWPVVLVGWAAVMAGLWGVAPRWEDVAHDGDFAYLPQELPSQQAEHLLRTAFPQQRAYSRVVLVSERPDGPLTPVDQWAADGWAAEWHTRHAVRLLMEELRERGRDATGLIPTGTSEPAPTEELVSTSVEDQAVPPSETLRRARDAIDAALDFQESAADGLERLRAALPTGGDAADAPVAGEDPEAAEDPGAAGGPIPDRAMLDAWVAQANRRLGQANALLARIRELSGQDGSEDLARARRYLGGADLVDLAGLATEADRWPVVGVMTWRHPLFGEKFRSHDRQARLIVVQLATEFAATSNVALVETLDRELADRRAEARARSPGLKLYFTGDAAIGGDMLRGARDSIRQTHLVTLALVAGFLALVYRSPLLVGIVLATLVAALEVSLWGIALAAQLWGDAVVGGWQYRVFTTTQIFIVAILFGSGTDFCLFLISRYREEIAAGETLPAALRLAVRRTAPALVGSAMTTVTGLGMLFFSEFGKSSSSGPTIAASLIVTLVACLTLTPAALAAAGPWAFWPSTARLGRRAPRDSPAGPPAGPASGGQSALVARVWGTLARTVAGRPAIVLAAVLLGLLPLVALGVARGHRVTYDITSEIDPGQPSRQGLTVLKRHFPIGETGPLTVLVETPHGDLRSAEGRGPIAELTRAAHGPGLRAVYSLTDPLGRPTPTKASGGLLNINRWRGWVAGAHHEAESLFTAELPAGGGVARLEIVGTADPFSDEALVELNALRGRLDRLTGDPDSYWHGARYAVTGTAALIADLKKVTRSDLHRTQVLVTAAVLLVLLVLLGRPDVCVMMVLTVLLGYWATLGLTEAFFAWLYGPTYEGLDWKVPLFLFVVLVAVGQDYNVYLATRVFEEQAKHGPVDGLVRGLTETGAIISSCGVIMAATFFSMTASGWVPLLVGLVDPGLAATFTPGLRGVIELGFAMTIGIALDTFVIRTLLFPSMLALRDRFWEGRRNRQIARGT